MTFTTPQLVFAAICALALGNLVFAAPPGKIFVSSPEKTHAALDPHSGAPGSHVGHSSGGGWFVFHSSSGGGYHGGK